MINKKEKSYKKRNSKEEIKYFHDLSRNEQQEIRKKYKNECLRDYEYSIRLYVIYVILGIIAVLGLFLILVTEILGGVIFILSFIFMIINIYFLNKSNENFYRFLKKNGYQYSRK